MEKIKIAKIVLAVIFPFMVASVIATLGALVLVAQGNVESGFLASVWAASLGIWVMTALANREKVAAGANIFTIVLHIVLIIWLGIVNDFPASHANGNVVFMFLLAGAHAFQGSEIFKFLSEPIGYATK